MCSSVRSFHHKSVSSYSYNSIPLYFALFFLICALCSSLRSFAHGMQSLIFSAFALSAFLLQVPPAFGYRPAPVVLPYLSPTYVKVGYICPQAPAVFLSLRTISDNLSELLLVPFLCSHALSFSAETYFSNYLFLL